MIKRRPKSTQDRVLKRLLILGLFLVAGCSTTRSRTATPAASGSGDQLVHADKLVSPITPLPTPRPLAASQGPTTAEPRVGKQSSAGPVRLASVDALPAASGTPAEALPQPATTTSAVPGPPEKGAAGIEPLNAPPDAGSGTELNLDGVIALALEANPSIHASLAQIDVADATLSRARAEFYPKLGVAELYGVTNNPVRAFMFQLNQAQFDPMANVNSPPTTDNFDTRVRVEQRLLGGGQLRAQARAAADQLAAASCSLAAVQNQLVFRVAEAYYRLLQANELVRVRQQAVTQVERHLAIVQARFQAETAVRSDVLSVEVRLAEVREALIAARNQRELAWVVLSYVAGVPLGRSPLPATVPPAPWAAHVTQAQAAVAEALGRRPELTALANQKAAAAEGVEAARAGKRFTLDFVTDYDVYTGDFARGNDSFFTGLVLQLNLFDGGRTSSDVCKAMARVKELEAHRRETMLSIELDVRQTYLRLADAQERLAVTSQAIGQAGESLREIEIRYRGENATIVQLIDAQVALSNAQVRDANARAEVEIARAALERAIGRLNRFVGR